MTKKEKKKVLLIEDDCSIIDVYKTAFETKNGFEVVVKTLGCEAIKEIDRAEKKEVSAPDIVLLDLIMPDMNGIEILREIRKRESAKNIPVFILTNYANQELEKMGYDLKAEKYITKAGYTPFQIVDLVKEKLNIK